MYSSVSQCFSALSQFARDTNDYTYDPFSRAKTFERATGIRLLRKGYVYSIDLGVDVGPCVHILNQVTNYQRDYINLGLIYSAIRNICLRSKHVEPEV